MSESTEIPGLTGRMYLYERPELLTKELHGELALKAAEKPFAFAAKARAIPITYGEVAAAMREYPLIFMSAEQPQLLAVTGIYDDVNLFVREDGKWADFSYVPGYVRRYPFGLAAENNGERMAVVIDRGYEGFGGEGRPLFDNGAPTEDTRNAIEYCKNYERDRALTAQFTNKMNELGLIQQQSALYTPPGSTQQTAFAQYHGIDEQRFMELPDDKILELRKMNFLPLVYAVLLSMNNWRVLLQRRAKRFNLTDENIFKPLSVS
ncbi:MAG: SapC family protein [Parvularculaceae bacterium]